MFATKITRAKVSDFRFIQRFMVSKKISFYIVIRFIELPETGELNNRQFNYACKVQNRETVATCSSKKGAKEKAAKALYDEMSCLIFEDVKVPTTKVTINKNENIPVNLVGTLITMCQQRKLPQPV